MTNIKWLVSGTWIILTILTCYSTYDMAVDNKKVLETLNMFLLMLGGFGVVFSIIHQTESIIENNKQISEKIKIDIIENTFQLLKDWDNEHLFSARTLTREIKDVENSISNEELIKRIDSNPELRQSVILVFNYFEHVRFSIKQNRINIELFKESLGVAIISIIKRFEPYSKKMGQQNHADMEECKQLLT